MFPILDLWYAFSEFINKYKELLCTALEKKLKMINYKKIKRLIMEISCWIY